MVGEIQFMLDRCFNHPSPHCCVGFLSTMHLPIGVGERVFSGSSSLLPKYFPFVTQVNLGQPCPNLNCELELLEILLIDSQNDII